MDDRTTQKRPKKPGNSGIFTSLVHFWHWVTKPNDAIQEVGQRHQALLLAGFCFVLFISVVGILILTLVTGTSQASQAPRDSLLFVLAFTFAGYWFSRTRYFTVGTLLIVAAFCVSGNFGALMGTENPETLALAFLAAAFIISGVLLSSRGILILTVANILFVALAKSFTAITWTYTETMVIAALMFGILLAISAATRNMIERDRLAETNRVNKELAVLSESLEQKVSERARDILVAAEVGQRIMMVQNLDELLSQAVELIRERFDLYYVQIYLMHPASHSLVMKAGSGETGAEILRENHRLPLNLFSINGTAAAERRAVTVSDTTSSRTFRPHRLLPETRSEMAVPLIAGDRVLGVLDLQSSKIGGFTEAHLPVFQTLAGQLAAALVNAELFERIESTLAESEARSRRVVREGWETYLDGIHEKERVGYEFDQGQVKPLENPLEETQDPLTLNAPIEVAGEPVGAFQFVSDRPWQPEQAEIVHTIVSQVAQQVENLRLLAQAERYRAESEEAVRRLTHEEWGDYLQAVGAGAKGYAYAQDAVQPLEAVQDAFDGGARFEIKVRDEAVGQFGFSGVEALSPEDAELVAAVSEQLGAHLENMRLYTTAQQELVERRKAEGIIAKRASELVTVSEVATVVATIQNPEQMLQTVVDLAKASFGLYHAHIYLLNEAGDTLVLTRGAGEVGRQMVAEGRKISLQAEKSLVARAARTHQGVIVNNVRQDPEFLPNPLLPDTRSELAAPMIVGEQLLGVLDIQSAEVNHFNEEDISIQTTLASQVAVALQNARQYAQTQESEQLTRTVINSTPDWIFIKDQQHRYRLVNQGYANSLHIPIDAFMGKNDLDLGFPEELVKGNPEKGIAGFWADDRAVMDGGVPKIIPKDVVMIDGKERTFNTLKTPLRDSNGNVWGVLAFGRDVTEREELLANTAASEQLIRTVIDATPDWIFIKGRDHRFRLANQGYANSMHLKLEDIVGKDDLELGFPEELVKGDPEKGIAGFWADDLAVMDSGVPKIIPRDLVVIDGKERILNTLKTPLRDSGGSVWGVLAFARDVTEREEMLANTEALYTATSLMARARSYDEILKVVVENSILKAFDHTLVNFFNRPWDETPDTLTVVSYWEQVKGSSQLPLGQPVPVKLVPVMNLIASQPYLAISDTRTDPRLSDNDRAMLQQINNQALINFQLRVGDRWVGSFSASSLRAIEISEADFRRLVTLVEQATTVIQSLQLFEAVQARARREQILREITARVRNSMDADTILRTAVQELGAALGRPAFIRVGSAEQLVQKPNGKMAEPPVGASGSGINGEGGR